MYFDMQSTPQTLLFILCSVSSVRLGAQIRRLKLHRFSRHSYSNTLKCIRHAINMINADTNTRLNVSLSTTDVPQRPLCNSFHSGYLSLCASYKDDKWHCLRVLALCCRGHSAQQEINHQNKLHSDTTSRCCKDKSNSNINNSNEYCTHSIVNYMYQFSKLICSVNIRLKTYIHEWYEFVGYLRYIV